MGWDATEKVNFQEDVYETGVRRHEGRDCSGTRLKKLLGERPVHEENQDGLQVIRKVGGEYGIASFSCDLLWDDRKRV